MLAGAPGETQLAQGLVQLRVPCTGSLTKPVQRLLELQDLAFMSSSSETWRLPDIYFLLELAIQER